MFAKLASISFVLTLSAVCGHASADMLAVPAAGEAMTFSPAAHHDLSLPPVKAPPKTSALPHSDETPTAPLPPALWPGLLVLVTLGGAKVMVSARRRLARAM